MEKLLHERILELPEGSFFDDLGMILGIGEKDDSQLLGKYWDMLMKALAKEIERHYIPRPRFEDGEPVDWYDKDIEWERGFIDWTFNAINDRGIPLAVSTDKECSKAKMSYDGFVIRKPKPKVLDADGVEINVGDTVWVIGSGYKHVIEEAHEDGCVTSDGIIVHQRTLTHKYQDSLEKIRDDMMQAVSAKDVTHGCMQELIYRLTEFIDRSKQ